MYEYAVLARDAYAKCRMNTLAIDNTAWEWPQYYNNILDFLNLTYMPDPILSSQELVQHAGSFQNVELGVSIHIEMQDEQLIIFGNLQLKTRDVHTFYLDHISMSLEFIPNDAGGFSSFIMTEKDLIGNQKDEGTIRNLVAGIVYGLTFGIGVLISAFMVGLREDKRAIHDFIAGTEVVYND